ncbi:MAG: hypothetical protein OXD31_15190, partial [Chloroflexi bacterium]|nr:hypothetical protein [Chloroflexota bacterium]
EYRRNQRSLTYERHGDGAIKNALASEDRGIRIIHFVDDEQGKPRGYLQEVEAQVPLSSCAYRGEEAFSFESVATGQYIPSYSNVRNYVLVFWQKGLGLSRGTGTAIV